VNPPVGADVQTGSAGHRDLPMIQRGFQLQAAAADVSCFSPSSGWRIFTDRRSGLFDFLLAHQDAPARINARARSRLGTRARSTAPDLPGFFRKRLLFQAPSPASQNPALSQPTTLRYVGSWQCYQFSPIPSLPIPRVPLLRTTGEDGNRAQGEKVNPWMTQPCWTQWPKETRIHGGGL